MTPSILDPNPGGEDLLALRRAITLLAKRCQIDLADRAALRRLLDGDFSDCRAVTGDVRDGQDLRALLTLLFRLEASSSEDLGIAGLRRLWRQHGKVLARFRPRRPRAGGRPAQLAAT